MTKSSKKDKMLTAEQRAAIRKELDALNRDLELPLKRMRHIVAIVEAAGSPAPSAKALMGSGAKSTMEGGEAKPRRNNLVDMLRYGNASELSENEFSRLERRLSSRLSSNRNDAALMRRNSAEIREGIEFVVNHADMLSGWAGVLEERAGLITKSDEHLQELFQAEKKRRKAEAEANRPMSVREVQELAQFLKSRQERHEEEQAKKEAAVDADLQMLQERQEAHEADTISEIVSLHSTICDLAERTDYEY